MKRFEREWSNCSAAAIDWSASQQRGGRQRRGGDRREEQAARQGEGRQAEEDDRRRVSGMRLGERRTSDEAAVHSSARQRRLKCERRNNLARRYARSTQAVNSRRWMPRRPMEVKARRGARMSRGVERGVRHTGRSAMESSTLRHWRVARGGGRGDRRAATAAREAGGNYETRAAWTARDV